MKYRVSTFTERYFVTKEEFFNNLEDAVRSCEGDCNVCELREDNKYHLVGSSMNGVYYDKELLQYLK